MLTLIEVEGIPFGTRPGNLEKCLLSSGKWQQVAANGEMEHARAEHGTDHRHKRAGASGTVVKFGEL